MCSRYSSRVSCAPPTDDDGRAGGRGRGEDVLRPAGLLDRVEACGRGEDDVEVRRKLDLPQPLLGLCGRDRERAPAVGERGRPAKRAQRASADPDRDVFLHRARIDDHALEVVEVAVVCRLGLGQRRAQGAQGVVGRAGPGRRRARR